MLTGIIIIIVGNGGSIQGQVAQAPAGGITAASSAIAMTSPFGLTIVVCILGVFASVALVSKDAVTRRQPRTLKKGADQSLPGPGAQGVANKERSIEVPPGPFPTSPLTSRVSVCDRTQSVAKTRGQTPRIRASESLLGKTGVARPRGSDRDTEKPAASAGRDPWVVEFVIPSPRSDRIELELRLSQLRSWKERGLITRTYYEEEKIRIMRRLHPSHRGI